jgi:hypothetical protein
LENWAQNPPVLLLSHLFAAIKIGDPRFSDTNPESLDVRDVLSSGYLTVFHGKSPFLIGKRSINGPFSMAMLNNQRVSIGEFSR